MPVIFYRDNRLISDYFLMMTKTIRINILTHIFGLFLISLLLGCNPSKTKDTTTLPVIGIQPLGDFDDELAADLAEEIELFYEISVYILNPVDIPEHAFVNVKTPRYRADTLLRYLKTIKPDSIDYIMGLTEKDISTTKRNQDKSIKEPVSKYEDFGIFGLGYRPGSACIISTFRYKNVTTEQFQTRFIKICIHELGHNFGLPHCETEKCLMNDAAESISTIDNVHYAFCKECCEYLFSKHNLMVSKTFLNH